MDDVDADAEFPAQPDHQFDGFVLGSARPGLQIRFVAPCRVLYSSGIDGTGQFCVNKQHAALRGNKGQDLPEICFSYVRKFINSRRHEEALESEYTRGDQRLDLIGIARNHTAPETGIHPAPISGAVWFRAMPI